MLNKELKNLEKKGDNFQLKFKDDTQENYKTVIITAPFQQAYNLTKQFTESFFSKFDYSMQPNLTLMVAFNKSLNLNLSAISFEDDDVLGFAANENTKKKDLINKDLELWTIQSSLKYAIKNIYEYRNNKQNLIDEMLKIFSTKLKIDFKKDNIQYHASFDVTFVPVNRLRCVELVETTLRSRRENVRKISPSSPVCVLPGTARRGRCGALRGKALSR